MIDHETTRRQDDMSGEHRPLVCCFRQLAESWDRRATVEAALSAATPRPSQATRLREASSRQARPFGYRSGQALPLQLKQRGHSRGFTLAELLVSVGVLVLLALLATQLLNSAATITTLGHKQMDADSQARQLLDRMAIDFAQMVKRSDVDYYVKSSAAAPSRRAPQVGNDQITFYSTVPGYYPPASSAGSQSPVSLVAYRINSQNKLERMGKGLVWNAAFTNYTPVVFIPIPLASPLPTPEMPLPTPNPMPTPAWPEGQSMATDWSDSEVIGPQVFRFEYYYLLTNGTFSDIPWVTTPSVAHIGVDGMQDVSAIVVDIAVIDPKSKVLLTDAQITSLAGQLVDYSSGMVPGQLRAQWQNTLNGITSLPRPAISGIRLYERYFYLSPPTLLTP
jgi:type II secretion system protein J